MTDLPVSLQISRPAGGPLELNDGSTYRIARAQGLEPGGRLWRRDTVSSPYYAGRQLVGAVLDVVTSTITVRVLSATLDGLQVAMQQMVDALSQAQFTATSLVGPGGHQWSFAWACEPADLVPLGADASTAGLDTFGLTASPKQLVIRATIPHSPVPVTGGPF